MLILGALLMVLVGGVFATTGNFFLLLIVATIGVLSPADKEVGPFLRSSRRRFRRRSP